MNQNYYIGVDISKSKIDCALINAQFDLLNEKEVKNTDPKVKMYLMGIMKKMKLGPSELVVCCENTGIYNRPLERICLSLGIRLWVEHPLKIKRASTDMRGKNDQKDAIRIAEYAARYQDKMVLYIEPADSVKELNFQVKIRETLMTQKVAIENQIREAESHDNQEFQALKEGYKVVLKTIKVALGKIEDKIEELSKKDASIAENIMLMKTIPGIGTQSATNMVIVTNNFLNFKDAKHLACYAGVVPFQNQSGTIIKKDRISKMANLKIKKLLHLAAMAACKADPEIKAYYIRKVKEGKNKMSVLNAIRNKLVHRIMAVITRKKPYLKLNEGFYQNRNNNVCILT
jgi:transposase